MMRRSLLAAVVLGATCLIAAPADAARITAEKPIDARVVELTIETSAFAAPTHVQVDLPTGYDDAPARRWPVTYYLAGTNHRYTDFNADYAGERLTAAYPSIVVAPDGRSGYWSDWYNGGAFGPPKYESFVIGELIGLIDAHFRTIADRAHRAVLGESMGGYGTMMLAARHPDLFAGASSLSGAVDSNLAVNGLVLSASSVLDGAAFDAIYGPRSAQEVRWHGHNPTDLADNLRDVDLQVGTADGVPAPQIGEGVGDVASCPVELGVEMASVDFHEALTRLHIAHAWRPYGAGCHSVPNFERQITDSLKVFTNLFARPHPVAAQFDYRSIEPRFTVWGWRVSADPARALEFLKLRNVGRAGLKLTGSGLTTIVTPRLFKGHRRAVKVTGATSARVVPDARGRLHFTVDLGPANRRQQYTQGTSTVARTRTVSFSPRGR